MKKNSSSNIGNVAKSGTPILRVLELLNSQIPGRQFAVIVDSNDIVIGALTDGDVRRALLKGKQLAGNVDDFMNPTPLLGHTAEKPIELDKKLQSMEGGVRFLPVVDAYGVLVDVRLYNDKKTRRSQALIMAGGFGTRLGEITRNVPKPLVKYKGKPLIEYVLKYLESSEVDEIYVSVFYLANQIVNYLEQYKTEKSLTIIEETEPLGTAGSVKLMPLQANSDIIISNSDVVSEIDIDAMLNFHRSNSFDVTIASANYSYTIPFGVVQHDAIGRFEEINEKPTISNRIAAGIYCLKSELINDIDVRGSIEMPSLLQLLKKNNKDLGIFPMHEDWHDVGRPEDLVY